MWQAYSVFRTQRICSLKAAFLLTQTGMESCNAVLWRFGRNVAFRRQKLAKEQGIGGLECARWKNVSAA